MGGVNQEERRLVYEGKKAKTKGGMTKADIVLDKGVYKSRKQVARGKALSSTYGPPTKEQSAKGRAKAKQVRASGGSKSEWKARERKRSGRKPGTDCHLLSKRGRAACERAAKRAQKNLGPVPTAAIMQSLGVPVAPAAPQYKVRGAGPKEPEYKTRGRKMFFDIMANIAESRPSDAPIDDEVLIQLEKEDEYRRVGKKEKKKMEVATTLLAASDRPSDTAGLLAAVDAAVEAQPLADNTSIFAKVAFAPIAAVNYILDTGTEEPMFDDPERAAAQRKYDARTALEEKEVKRISMKIDGFQREAKRAMERGDPDAHNRASRKRDMMINKLRSKYGVEYKWE